MDFYSSDFTGNDFNEWDPTGVSSSTDVDMPSMEVNREMTTDFEQDVKTGDKRHNRCKDNEPPTKKPMPSIQLDAGFKWNLHALAKAAESVEFGGKSPVSALNELGVRVAYSVLKQRGPAHCPSFTVAVAVPKFPLSRFPENKMVDVKRISSLDLKYKHPISILNEYSQGFVFRDIGRTGSEHLPNFCVEVIVADMSFEGWGHSKREARAAAAKTCLNALLARAGRVLPNPGPAPDFTSDEPPKYPVSDFQCVDTKIQPPDVNKSAPPPGLFGSTVSPIHKSPINTLYENYPGLTFTCTFGDGTPLETLQAPTQLSHSMRFKVVVQIKDQVFEGFGSSKKLAKLAAARAALGELSDKTSNPLRPASNDVLPQLLADHIAKLVNEKFNQLMRDDLIHSKRKVLAGIVMTVDNKIEGAKVIAVTTGTKCVSGEHMSVRGRVVNDSHAEVAARRCLQRHLYAQLLMYAQATDPTVPIPESDLEPVPGGGYQLRGDRQLHLYVSTAPCGDGRIFSPHDKHELEPDRHPNRLARGQLRTKIESGEGTIPVKNCSNIVQTWDGVLQGERLLTMSCSDKAARWAVAGLQGALLARLLRPVYLRSLVLGSLLHHHHLYRAICGRIESFISSLPPPYELQRPLLARAASTEARTPARAPSFSVCWSITAPQPEIINATTGKLESGHPSLLCKQSMFARWHYLVNRLPLLPPEPSGPEFPPLPEDLENIPYNEAKNLCTTYQIAKERLTKAFETAQLGRWIKKPIEQDHFTCEILGADPNILFI